MSDHREVEFGLLLPCRLRLEYPDGIADVVAGSAYAREHELMAKHVTGNTQSVSKWCNKCAAFTQHACSSNRVAHCIPCAERQEKQHQENLKKTAPATQKGLFE